MILPDTIRRALATLLVGSLGVYLARQIWGSLQAIPRPLSANALPSIENALLSSAVRIPWLIAILLLVWVWWMARRLNENPLDRSVRIRDRYERDPSTDMMIHKKTKLRYCRQCILREPPVEAELHAPSEVVSKAECSAPGCKAYFDTPERIAHFQNRRRANQSPQKE